MYCPQCGNSNPDDAAFCRICGTDLRTYKQRWDEWGPDPSADTSAAPAGSEQPADTAAQPEQPEAGATADSPPPYQSQYQPQYPPAYQAQYPQGGQTPPYRQAPPYEQTPSYQPTHQPPYQPTYQPGYGRVLPQVPSYMAWAIVTLILCFWPTGIVAVVYASHVGSRLSIGDLAGAQESSHKAKTWCWITFAIGLALWIIGIIIFLVAIFAAVRFGIDSSNTF